MVDPALVRVPDPGEPTGAPGPSTRPPSAGVALSGAGLPAAASPALSVASGSVREVRPVPGGAGRRAALRRSAPTSAALPELVAAARTGDPEALDALVRATYADAYALAYRLTGDDDDARDVVQDAYLRAHRGLASFRGDAQFTTWLYRITVNCATTAIHKRRRARTEPLPDDAAIVDQRVDRDPEWRATSADDRAAVAAALAALPARLRQVIVLRDIYDLPHRAIAEELGISEAAAKVRLHRARRRLKTVLAGVAADRAGGGAGGRAR